MYNVAEDKRKVIDEYLKVVSLRKRKKISKDQTQDLQGGSDISVNPTTVH